jgi:iron complex transport system ATP-binding protein
MEKGQIAIYDTPEAVFNSKEINRIFKISSKQVPVENEALMQYVFYINQD